MKPKDFKDSQPRLSLEDYFMGQTLAWGIFEDRFGRLRRQFQVDIVGTFNGDELVLDEHFTYSDGELDRRIWHIRRTAEHSYEGRADDVFGVARGKSYGNSFYWSYRVALKIGEKSVPVRFKDWMFLQPGGVLVNRARVSKLGITIGEVTLTFVKPGLIGALPDTLESDRETASQRVA